VIDRMTLAEAGEIFRHWEQNPPAHLMLQTIARLIGWSPSVPSPGAPGPEHLLATAPPGLAVTRGGDIGMPAPVLEADALRARNLAASMAIARQNAGHRN
jgi:hypothetical protein